MKRSNVSLFVPHVGCPHKCVFCNQNAISGEHKVINSKDVDDAVNIALKSGIDGKLSEIAFFGGSFTAIKREYMTELLESAYKYVKEGFFKGIRCSTRPDYIDDSILTILKNYGVTSIELGVESMSDKVLKLNERGHKASDVINASNLIKSYGFELGLQMMTGLYGSSDESDIYTAGEIISLKPETMRIYPTIVLKNTRLADYCLNGLYNPPTLEESVNLCSKLILMFNEAQIRIIRLGLHSGGDAEENYVAGAYHPAFKELCESKIYFDKALDLINRDKISGDITIFVPKGETSKMTGQKRANINALKKLGATAKIKEDDDLKKYEIRVSRQKEI